VQSSQSLFDSASQYKSSQYGAIWFTREPGSALVGNASSNVSFSSAMVATCNQSLAAGVLDYASEADCARLGVGYGYVVQYNHTGLHGAPLYQALADQALLRSALNNPALTIAATIAPLPVTKIEDGLGDAENTFTAWFLVMMGFPFIAGAYASFLVVERESKAKHLQTVAGVEPAAYWLSTLLWDTINYQIPLWLMVAELFLFDIKSLTTSSRDVFSGILAILFLYGPASAGFAYCWSFAFKSASLCNIVLIVSGFLIGFGGPLTVFILILIGSDRGNPIQLLVDIATALTWILRFIPAFNLGKGLFFAINIESIAFLEGDVNLSAWSEPVLLVEVIFLLWQGVGYSLLAILIDVWSNNPHFMKAWNDIVRTLTCKDCTSSEQSTDITTALKDDDDVVAEEERVLSGGANEDLIVLDQISKIYSNGKVAVNGLSLGIPHGECFGLLGINGECVGCMLYS
jgi:ATP-binding cassette, subfamily A (ABC1), member 3